MATQDSTAEHGKIEFQERLTLAAMSYAGIIMYLYIA